MRRQLILLLLVVASTCGSDFVSKCPNSCKCKWSNGRKLVDCTGDKFTSIPTNVSPDVQVLTMDGNYIKELTKNIFNAAGLRDLQKLSLQKCHIQTIHEDAFANMKNLQEINLSGNNITKLRPKTFDGNERLRHLILSDNQLIKLQAYQFPPLPSLKTITLSRAGLSEVDPEAFMNLDSVEDIDLSGNMLTNLKDNTFLPLNKLKILKLTDNPWHCDCKLQTFRDYIVHRNLFDQRVKCAEPSRLADKIWTDVKSSDFACKPEIEILENPVHAKPGQNVTLSCIIIGNPPPSARWVLRSRILQNNTAPLHSAGVHQQYILQEQALAEAGVERNYSLTITNVRSDDQGEYNCVAVNQGGVAERNVTLTFSAPGGWGGAGNGSEMTALIGAAAGGILFLIVLIIVLCCVCRRRGKDKTGHTHNGSLLSYSDSAGEKLLANTSQTATLQRTNPLPKPPRAGEYGMLPQNEQELPEYGPASYVPGDRYGGLGGGRTSASNSDQTGTLSRAFYHSSDPDHYPDLLDIPNSRYKQASPTSVCTSSTSIPPYHANNSQQPLHPAHLIPAPGHHPHFPPPPPHLMIQRSNYPTATLPHNFTLPHHSHIHPHQHPRSVSCDHGGGGGGQPHVVLAPGSAAAAAAFQPPVNTQQRPGYVTLPRRPRSSWAGRENTPSPGATLNLHRDPIYDGVGPRTSADGSSKLSLNRSMDSGAAAGPNVNRPLPGLPPYCPPQIAPIDETPEIPGESGKSRTKSSPNIVSIAEPLPVLNGDSGKRRAPISTSQQTLLEENLAAYCEPFGKALPPGPNSPGNRDSLASTDSEILPDRKTSSSSTNGMQASEANPAMCSTPKSNGGAAPSSQMTNGHKNGDEPPPALHTIPETAADSSTNGYDTGRSSSSAGGRGGSAKKQAPPTLPKPKSRPKPPPKPAKSSSAENGSDVSYQDETMEGSEV